MSPEPTVIDVANVLLRRWRVVIGVPLGAALIVAVGSFFVPPTFTARASFVPEARGQRQVPTALAGLVGQLGIQLGGEASNSPRFYGALVQSREIAERVLQSRYLDPRAGAPPDSATLLDILQIRGDSVWRLYRGVKQLKSMITLSVDNTTNIVQLAVDARYPRLASDVANRLITYLNEFNTSTRQSQARERRRFTETRLGVAEQEMRSAEDDLRRFYERNRSFEQSPQLRFEEGQLRRRVDIRQEVSRTLSQEYEIARIEEVNDAPVITIIEPATPPPERSKPNRRLWTMLAFIAGVLVAVFAAFGANLVERLRTADDERSRELRRLVDDVRSEVGLSGRGRRDPAHPTVS